jgi:hypothetical protein
MDYLSSFSKKKFMFEKAQIQGIILCIQKFHFILFSSYFSSKHNFTSIKQKPIFNELSRIFFHTSDIFE